MVDNDNNNNNTNEFPALPRPPFLGGHDWA